MIGHQGVLSRWGAMLGIILAVGLGVLARIRRPARAWRLSRRQFPLYWAPRGTSLLPWVTAIVMLVTPIALADFDYRYLLPVIPFACLAAGLAFTPSRASGTGAAASSAAPSRRAHTPR